MADNSLAYGFSQYRHLTDQRVQDISGGSNLIYSAVEETLAEYNRTLNAMMSTMVQRTTKYQLGVKKIPTGTLQPLGTSGIPMPVREEGYWQMQFPIYGAGTAFGDDRVARAKMLVEEANNRTVGAMLKDADWLKRHMLGAIFYDGDTTFVDDNTNIGSLTVRPLADATAGELFPKVGGSAATDDHYLAQSAAISDAANPVPTIEAELAEHPGNSGPYVLYCATDQLLPTSSTGLKSLTNFDPVLDPDVLPGSGSNVITANTDAIRGPGDIVHGKVDGMWVVEWKALPDGYMIGQALGAGPFLAMREHEEASLQGFFPEATSIDGNHELTSFLRYAGFGVMNRVAAVVQYIGGASYTEPSDYTSMPLPV